MANEKRQPKSSAPERAQGNKPIFSARENGCVMSVFANPCRIEGKTVNRYRFTLSRREKRGDEFVTRYSFRTEDLDCLTKMIRSAKEKVSMHLAGMLDQDEGDSQAE
jgi:hypothetical protein